MVVNNRRNIHHVSAYITQPNSKQKYVAIYVLDILIMNVLRYNNQFDIWNLNKKS